MGALREFSGGVDELAVVAVAFKFRFQPAVLGGWLERESDGWEKDFEQRVDVATELWILCLFDLIRLDFLHSIFRCNYTFFFFL